MAQRFRKQRAKSLTELIGADYDILKSSGSKVVTTFYRAAFLLLVIVVLTFVSVREAMNMLFHSLFIEITFSVFFSGLFLLMYIFLLNTFSKQSLDDREKIFTGSNITRMTFVLFMAFVISKPLEIKILDNYVATETEQYKTGLLSGYRERLNQLVEKDVKRLHLRKSYLVKQGELRFSEAISNEVAAIDQSIEQIDQSKAEHIALAEDKIVQSEFFVFKIKSVSHHPLGWCIFFTVLALFVAPGYMIYSIAGDDVYYVAKKKEEWEIIMRSYREFTDAYASLFSKNYGANIDYYSVFADAPFNTIRKSDNKYSPQKEFLDRFLSS